MEISERIPHLSPWRITLAYAVFGLSWIIWSDFLLLEFVDSVRLRSTLQTLKGGLFVFFSMVIIWALTTSWERQLESIQSRLRRMSQHQTVLHRLFRHDIRNELNVIKGNVDMVRDTEEADLPDGRLEVASETAETILDISEKLKILDQYGIEGDGLDESVDIVCIAEDAIDGFTAQYPAVTVRTDLPATAWVVGDGSIHYIFQELLENAVKHFDGNVADLEVTIDITEQLEQVTVRVEDNGRGIPDDEQQALEQGKESSLVHLSGVGLWIVHWLRDRAGADMEIDSHPGKGTTITLEFDKPVSIPNLGLVGAEIMELKY